MTTLLDHTQDLTGAVQHRLTELYPPPAFVKNANHEQLYGDAETLPPHIYADATRRVYPCHTKAATWMSALFFATHHQNLPEPAVASVRDRLVKSATHWKIQADVDALWAKVAADKADGMSQLADSDFAFVWATTDGRKERHYPLRNALEVKAASAWFGKYHGEFTFADKHTVAGKILQKAAAFGAGIENEELLDRCAGFGYCAATTAAEAWEKRAQLVKRQFPDYSEQAAGIAVSLRNGTFEVRDQGLRIKLATLLDEFDRHTQLAKLYDAGGLDRPEDALFCITEKVASQFLTEHIQTTNGAVYEKAALASLSIDNVRQWMGDEFSNAVGGVMLDTTKLAEIVPTLPRGDAEMFERMASANGVRVFAREKAAAAKGLTPFQLLELASSYEPQEPALTH